MTYYYGLNKGDSEYAATSSTSSSTGKEIEIVVNNTNVNTKHELLIALTNLYNFVLKNNYPL